MTLDVTERKHGDEHRALLAEELNHRVKNSLATIQSIANQTLTHANLAGRGAQGLNARLQSLAAAHDLLTRESWDGATLAEIVRGGPAPVPHRRGRAVQDRGTAVRLPPRLAIAFVMALHELATNAVKYGALSTPARGVILNWDIVDGSQPGRLWLRWEEIGGPPVAEPARRGFGSRMIERCSPPSSGGTAQVEYRSRGVVATVEAPLPEAGAPSSKSTCTRLRNLPLAPNADENHLRWRNKRIYNYLAMANCEILKKARKSNLRLGI